jgi:hypothetical protein
MLNDDSRISDERLAISLAGKHIGALFYANSIVGKPTNCPTLESKAGENSHIC